MGGDVLLGIDEEGGTVTRLEAAHGSTLPGAAQLGRVDDAAVTRAAGAELGRRVRASGANVALAPVADVNSNPRNPVIGTRSFGDRGAFVARHVAAMVGGVQDAGVAACVKHFPGHGDTAVDSHVGLPRVSLPLGTVESEHLPPFQAAIDAGVAAVMTSHVVVEALGELPATLDARVLRMLRERGFGGAIVTDALDMAAIRAEFGAGPGAVRALLAGADLLCIGNPSDLGPKRGASGDEADYVEVRDALLAAVDDGTLPVAALERASASVARLSEWVASRPEPVPASPFDAAAIVRRAIGVHGSPGLAAGPRIVLDLRDRASGAVASTAEPFAVALGAVGFRVGPLGSPESAAALSDALGSAPADAAITVLVDAVQPGSPQRQALGTLAAARPQAILVNTGLPAPDALPLPTVDAFGSSRVTAVVVAEALAGMSGA
ncbi:glucosyltransferase [Leifsonia xyli subsp. cynodontis DSM 46306]|uniref:Glycoside hydrolase family 3 N-terminal domain-containing protein n=1 Tax=Leifsonia xyli subsp. cynodontis DSM 46306 TaxID=1389489 RepID=U3PFS8_LEIXC|nr:glycoside hydrolase family 3 N-terminal domain-containing protein [Leifsonia xyli]AGW42518.1 glucosyltransferase [Leifsonia xyli subsp. cynodontis DSM 46306]